MREHKTNRACIRNDVSQQHRGQFATAGPATIHAVDWRHLNELLHGVLITCCMDWYKDTLFTPPQRHAVKSKCNEPNTYCIARLCDIRVSYLRRMSLLSSFFAPPPRARQPPQPASRTTQTAPRPCTPAAPVEHTRPQATAASVWRTHGHGRERPRPPPRRAQLRTPRHTRRRTAVGAGTMSRDEAGILCARVGDGTYRPKSNNKIDKIKSEKEKGERECRVNRLRGLVAVHACRDGRAQQRHALCGRQPVAPHALKRQPRHKRECVALSVRIGARKDWR